MAKPVYYIHKALNQSNEEIEKKIGFFQDVGFKIVIISDGEEIDISSCLKKIIYTNLHEWK
ncbi:MAG: hypothetical protein GX129_04810 [Clostridiales bacterium]|nr:hypothetical protein [Clostridiales bacterium]